MKYLLDTSVLLSSLIENHPDHQKTFDWLQGKQVVVCPLVELGFLRISIGTYKSTMEKSRTVLGKFIAEMGAERIPDDLPALESHPQFPNQISDFYLADLAARHGHRFATLDRKVPHSSVELL